MKNAFRLGLLWASLCFSIASRGDVSIAVVGLLNSSDSRGATTSGVAVDHEMATGIGFGALLGADLSPLFGFELGLLYVPRKFSLLTATTRLNMLMIPAVFRFTALPILSFGVGAYYARGLGNIQVTTAGVSVDSTYEVLSVGQNDFGLLGSIAADIPIAPLITLVADARLLLGLVDLKTTVDTFSFTDVQILAGLRFEL